MSDDRFEPRLITNDEFREFREERGLSVLDARKIIMKEALTKAFNSLMEEGTVEDKVNWLLKRWAHDNDINDTLSDEVDNPAP